MYLKKLLALVCVLLLLLSELAPLAVAATTPAPASASKAAAAAPKPAPKPAAAKPVVTQLATISSVSGNANSIVVKADARLSPAAKVLTSPDRILIYVPNAKLAYDLNKSGSVIEPFAGVSGVRVSNDATSTRLIIDLTAATKYTIQPSTTGFSIVLGAQPTAVTKAASQPVVAVTKNASPAVQKPVAVVKPPVASPAVGIQEEEPVIEVIKPANTTPAAASVIPDNTSKKVHQSSVNPDIKTLSFGENYSDENPFITINAKDADVRDILQMFADRANMNLIMDKSVAGNISLSINNMPFNDALNVVLKLNELSAKKIGTTLVVATTVEFAKKEMETTVAKAIKLNNAKATDVAAMIKAALPTNSKANIVVDDRTSSILITGTQTDLDRAESIVAAVDIKTKQVLIEVKLIDLTDSDTSSLGGKFGLGTMGTTTSMTFNGPPANMPGLQDAINLTYNSLGGMSNSFMATLDLMIKTKQAKVLANPIVATQENVKATVEITDKIITGVTTQQVQGVGSTTTLTTEDVGMKVELTPKISYDGSITMEVHPTLTAKGEDLTIIANTPISAKVKREANTTMRVKDGETIVIAGLKQTQTSKIHSKVPLLGDLPFIGYLFSNTAYTKKSSDVLILVTPHIVGDTTPAAIKPATPDISSVIKNEDYIPGILIKDNVKKTPAPTSK